MPSPSAPAQAEIVLNNLRRHRKGLDATLEQLEALPGPSRMSREMRREAKALEESARRAADLSGPGRPNPGKG